MPLENFNQLPSKEREENYNFFCSKYNKENIDYFFEKTENTKHFNKTQSYFLSKDFSLSKWSLFVNIFDWNNFSNFKKEQVSKIKEDLLNISKVISKFNHIDEMFSMDVAVAGGALRDLLLMDSPKIKDIDIILSFRYKKKLIETFFNSNPNKIDKDKKFFFDNLETTNYKLQKLGFPKVDIQRHDLSVSLDDLIKNYIFSLISIILSNQYNIISKYQTELKSTKTLQCIVPNLEYVEKHLKGLIKIKDSKLNFDIDVLLTSISAESYLNAFDYSICKMLMIFVQEDNNRLIDMDDSKFINSVVISEEIYIDLEKNYFTFNIDNFSVAEILRSIKKHLPRLKEKYPKFKLNLISPRGVHAKSFMESIELMDELSNNLSSKKDKSNYTKI